MEIAWRPGIPLAVSSPQHTLAKQQAPIYLSLYITLRCLTTTGTLPQEFQTKVLSPTHTRIHTLNRLLNWNESIIPKRRLTLKPLKKVLTIFFFGCLSASVWTCRTPLMTSPTPQIHAVWLFCQGHLRKYVPNAISFLLATKTVCSNKTKCMLNTIHSHHNSFCMDDFLRGIWFIFESIALIIFLFYFFYTDCRYPVVIICSINTILSYYFHSSFKKKKRKEREKRKYWHISVWETIKRRSEESFHHLSHHSEAKGTELFWSWNTFIIKHWKHSQEMMLYSEKKKKCCVYDVNTSHTFSVSKAFRHLSDSNLKNQFESIWYTMPS